MTKSTNMITLLRKGSAKYYTKSTFLIDNDGPFFVKLVPGVFMFGFFILVPAVLIILASSLAEFLMHLGLLSRLYADPCIVHVFALGVFQGLIRLLDQLEVLLGLL